MREIIGTNTICCSSCVKLFCSRLKNLPCMMALCRSDQKVGPSRCSNLLVRLMDMVLLSSFPLVLASNTPVSAQNS